MDSFNSLVDLSLFLDAPISSSTALICSKIEPKSEPVDDSCPKWFPVAASNRAFGGSALPPAVLEFARLLKATRDPDGGGTAPAFNSSAVVASPITGSCVSIPPISFEHQKRVLVRYDAMMHNDFSFYRERVRKTRMLYASLRLSAIFEADQTSLGAATGKRSRTDLRAASFMKERGLYLHLDEKVVGSVPGVCIGDVFLFRMEMCVVGLHSQPQAGIDYLTATDSNSGIPFATSVIVSGGYEDDEDFGDVVTYCGHGGRDKFNRPCCDQKAEGGNLALINSMKSNVEIRVIRGKKIDGIRFYVYDGLYMITNAWCAPGKSGYSVYNFRLVRLEGQEEMGSRKIELANFLRTRPMEVRPKGYLTFDLSWGKENVPVLLFNDVDSDSGPMQGEYLPRTIFPLFVYQTFACSISVGCNCIGGCNSNCSCAIKNGWELPYDSDGFLVKGKPVIFECGANCKCSPNCRNRVSQRGLHHRLEVFRSREAGWRVRTLELIQPGAFICEFSGVVLNRDQARVLSMAGDEPIYPARFAPNWTQWGDLSSTIPNIPPPQHFAPQLDFAIDVSSMRNVASYMSHSFSPNVMVQFVLYDHNNLMFPRAMLFAMETIPPMQELTIDYRMPNV